MHSKNIIPIFFIVASLMSTTLGLHHLVVSARRSLDIIMARQTIDQCLAICTSANSTVTSCTTVDCLCTTANAVSIQACVNCVIALDPTVSIVSSAQNIIDVFESECATVTGIPSVTINTVTNPGISLSTPTSTESTVPIPGPVTTISQTVIGPSSAPPQAASSVGSTSTAGIGGFPLKSSASPNEIILHWTVALLGLAAGNLMVF